jgi:hypothetical protein
LPFANRQPVLFSVFVFVLVFVVTLLFHDVQLDGIESNNFQISSTLFTRNDFALVRVQINVDISLTFRASSGRHFFFLPALCEGRDTPPVVESTSTLVSNHVNLPASAGICNSLFPGFLAQV